MDLKGVLHSYSKLVESELSPYLDRDVDELYIPLRDLISRGGKRIRPVMCLISCEAVGGAKEDAKIIGAAIEMVHNFTLIHDDIADKSELRRGEECLHHKYGLGPAINAGDGMFAVSYEAMADAGTKIGGKEGFKVMQALARAVTRVSEGQAMDIAWAYDKRWDLNENDYFRMIRGKTGALIAASCAIGGMVGKGGDKEVAALEKFGMNLGVSFQIHDDVLNLRGDVKNYGKEIGGDINEGKRTLIVIYTLSVCTQEERKLLINILDKERNSQEEIMSAIEIFEKYGSIERAEEKAKDIIEEGKCGLGELPESRAKETLLAIADYMVQRKT